MKSPDVTESARILGRVFLLAAALLAAAPRTAAGQRVEAPPKGESVLIETSARGLPRQEVRRVAQDRNGYLLLATYSGVGVFDGVRFRVHQSRDEYGPDSLPDMYVRDVIVSRRDGAVWLATQHAGVVEYRGGRFHSYGTRAGVPEMDVSVVYEDGDGNIWAGTQAGLARYVSGRFETLPGTLRLNVYALGEDADGVLWIGTDAGLKQLVDGRVVTAPIAFVNVARIARMKRARDGTMWIATGQGLAKVVRDRQGKYTTVRVFGARDGLKSSFITSIAEAPDGDIWVGSLGGGIARIDRAGRVESFGTKDGLADNNVNDVFVDSEGTLWVGTADGLSHVRHQALGNWTSSDYWVTSMVWSVRVDRDGTVWVGTGADGVARIANDGSSRRYTTASGLPSDAVFTSYRARDGTLWVGTKLGIARQAGDRFVDVTRALGMDPVGVRTIYEDSRGRFYVGTDTGLFAGTKKHVTALRRGAGLFAGRVYNLVEDTHGRLWEASHSLNLVEGDSIRRFRPVHGDSLPNVMDVYADSVGLWVGDYQHGLSLVRGDSVLNFPPQWTGIFPEVLNIVDDGRGYLWLTSDKGLERVRKLDLLAWLKKNPSHVPTRIFTKDDGLRSHDFAKSGSSSGARDAKGRLWLPTTSGLVMLDPAGIKIDAVVPEIFIERVIADGAVLRAERQVTLPRGTRETRIEFTTPMLAAPSRVRMWYKLEGVDTAFRQLEDAFERSATYRDLPRGRFTFLVRAQSADGVHEDRPAEIEIVSAPPITRSWWFWIALVTVVGATATTAYRWRVNRLRAHSAFLQRLVDERTDSLAERERLEHQLLHAQKLESVGRLAGGVAHDLNNLLTAILGHTELALIEPDVPASLRADLNEVRTVTIRAANLTRQLLAFARKQVVQPRVLQLGDLVVNAATLVQRLLGDDIEFTTEALEGDWTVRADPNQVEQVIINLAVNARDAMPRGGRLAIRTRAITVDARFVNANPGFAPGAYVLLEVVDTGTGMPPEVMAHLFEPFFTTKEQGKGTGLGLATAFGIVTQSGGHILVDSHVGVGTTFSVYLPRATGELALASTVPADMPRGTERLLLVEDERAVRAVAERTLRALGYVVTTAGDGVEAMAVLEGERPKFALVLTDVRMPRLDGMDLADRIRAHWPHVRVRHMSGHSEALLAGGALSDGPAVLVKPFTASELAVFVRMALDADA